MSSVIDGPSRTAEAMRKMEQMSGETIQVNAGDVIWLHHCFSELRREIEGRKVTLRAISCMDACSRVLEDLNGRVSSR